MANKSDYVELGLTCAKVCKALHLGMGGRELDDLSQSVREAIEQLKMWVEPTMRSFCRTLTVSFITEQWRRSRRRSTRRVNGIYSHDLPMQKMTRKRS